MEVKIQEPPLLDVHPPHEPAHGWRDFLLHIAIITIGLLIALGLEAAVEALHHRHLVAEARENIRHEIEDNRKTIAEDRKFIETDRKQMQANLVALRLLRDNPNAKTSMILAWTWSAPSSSAWITARDTGTLALMNPTTLQSFAEVYGQQQLVTDEGDLLVRNQTKALVPMSVEVDFKSAQPSQIDEALHRCAEVVVQLQLLDELIVGLDKSYDEALRKQ